MKRLVLIILLAVSITMLEASAQVTTNTGYTPTTLVNSVLLGGGVTASNITYTGYANGYSRFDATAGTNLGFTSGVYLTTGSVLQYDPMGWGSGTDGPLGPSWGAQDINQWGAGDADLDALLTNLNCITMVTYDASVLEFDFVPVTDTIQFRYRFGSEEYNDWVGSLCSGSFSEFNDVFAFYLEGVTTAYPKTNIALIPGTTTPVSIYTVNNGNSWADAWGPCMNCGYYQDNYWGAVDVVYDGLTNILTAVATVIPGQTYHIKLAIADAVDNYYDSGVFIEANSFTSFPMPVNMTTFNGECKENQLLLHWETSSEINNSHFIVQHSKDLINWEELGRVNGNGNSNVNNSYEWTSNDLKEDAYYRILQVDFDGTENPHTPIFIKACSPAMKLSVFIENHYTAILKMDNLPLGDYSVQLMDITGKVVRVESTHLSSNSQQLVIDLQSLVGGLYFVVVEGVQARLTERLMWRGL